MKKIAILQSNYIPWKGYFDLINMVDKFILYDDMQYTRRDWRNRNRIKTAQGTKWLTIPVEVKGKYFQKINETKISDRSWATKHWNTLVHHYGKSHYFKKYRPIFEALYQKVSDEKYLSSVNYIFLTEICKILDIRTEIRWSSEFVLEGERTERILSICRQCDAEIYLSGPSAKNYFDTDLARKWGITVEWMDYGGYPEYRQLFGTFEHGVTILDLLFNEGPNAKKFMKSFA